SQAAAVQRRIVTTRRGGVALWREANAVSSVFGVPRKIQPLFGNAPFTKLRTSALRSNVTTPVCDGDTTTSVAGACQALVPDMVQRAAPLQSWALLPGLPSIAQFQVAPASVQAATRWFAFTE